MPDSEGMVKIKVNSFYNLLSQVMTIDTEFLIYRHSRYSLFRKVFSLQMIKEALALSAYPLKDF